MVSITAASVARASSPRISVDDIDINLILKRQKQI